MRDYNFAGIILRLLLIVNIAVLIACSEAAEEAAKAEKEGKGFLEQRPVTEITPTQEFFREKISVNLDCTDPQQDCKNTYFSTVVQEPDQSSGNIYNNAFSINPVNNKATVVAFYSVDEAGNVEAIKTKTYVADTEGPIVGVTQGGRTYSTAIHEKFVCDDQGGSGCAYIHYSTNGIDYIRISIEQARLDGVLLNKDTTMSYFGEDNLGNVSIVTLDSTQKYLFANSTGDVKNALAEPSDGKVTLSWDNAASVNYQGAIIRRSTIESPADLISGIQIFRGDNTVNSFVDLDVQNGQLYYYTIFAYDDSVPENASLGSRVEATPTDNVPPLMVPTFSAVGGDKQVEISWTFPVDVDGDLAGVMVRRSVGDFPATSIDGTEVYKGTGLTTVDATAENNNVYYYSLFTYDEVPNYSEPGRVTATTRDTSPPVDVANFYAEAREGRIVLHWDLPLGHDIDSVIIRKDTAAYPTTPTSGTPVEDPSDPSAKLLLSPVEDANVTDGTTYFYTAFMYDLSGNVTDGAQTRTSATPMVEFLTTLTPAESAVDVYPFIRSVSGTFSSALDTTTPTTIADWLTLTTLSGKPVAGTVSESAGKVSFTLSPTETQLDLLANYKATLSGSILDTAGAAVLASDKSWTFTTADGTWGTAQPIVQNISNSSSDEQDHIALGVDDAGNIMAVWEQMEYNAIDNLHNRKIYSNIYSVENGIDANMAVPISNGAGSAVDVKLAVSGNGNAVAVWEQAEKIWAAAYTPANGWKVPVRMQDFRLVGATPDVAMNDSGDVAVVWKIKVGSNFDVWGNAFAFNNGDWSNIGEGQLIEFVSDKTVGRLSVKVASTGEAIAVWSQRDVNNDYMIQYSQYNPVTGWDAKNTPDSIPFGHPNPSFGVAGQDNAGFDLSLLLDGNDNLHAIWRVDSHEISANQYSFTDKIWTDPIVVGIPISVGAYQINSTHAAINESGVVVLAWSQSNNAESADNWLNRYLPESGWGGYIPAPEGAVTRDIDIDRNGNVKLISGSGNSNVGVRVYRIPASSDWIDVTTRDPSNVDKNRELVNIPSSRRIHVSRIISGPRGNAVAYWRSYDSTDTVGHVLANRFEYRLVAPDLVVAVDSVVANATGVTLNYTVTNNGTADATAFDVSFWANLSAPPVVGTAADVIVPIASLAAGASTTGLSVDIPTVLTLGGAYAAVDVANAILETEEANNISASQVWAFVAAPAVFDFENGVVPAVFLPSGSANWTFETFTDPQTVVFNYLRSGLISHSQQSCISVSALSASSVSFDYKTSSENSDKLRFYIDGTPVTAAAWGGAGVTALTPVTFTTTLGDHAFKWCYTKDSSVNTGDDAVWIDNVNIQ